MRVIRFKARTRVPMALPRIPRNRAFILTQADQAPAMLGWLRHLGRVIAAGFLV